MKLLLLGSNGQLGQELSRSLPSLGEVKACNRLQVDLTKAAEARDAVASFKPDIIVNAAAYTAVDRAQCERELAFKVNADAVASLANEAFKRNIWLIHYSTDYVFDGKKTGSYLETDLTNPVSVYGQSKLAGEKAIIESGCKHLIFRTSWVIGKDGNNFAKTILRLAMNRDCISIVNDQFGVPTSPKLISKVTFDAIEAIDKGVTWFSGIYHLVPQGKTTWFGIAQLLLELASQANMQLASDATKLKPIKTTDYPTAAKRPTNSCLATAKLATHLTFDLPDWKDDFSVTAKSIIEAMRDEL